MRTNAAFRPNFVALLEQQKNPTCMKVLIFAAGKGERLKPITEKIPKALVSVGGRPLIVHHLQRLAAAGLPQIVINCAYLGQVLRDEIGTGSRWGVRIRWSDEGDEALETGGGMLHALPLLGRDPFIALNADVYTQLDFARLKDHPKGLAHLVLVPNPAHNRRGDFALEDGQVLSVAAGRLTFSGIGAYRPELVEGYRPGSFKLTPVLRTAIAHRQVSGEYYEGSWHDVGTPERLAEVDEVATHDG